MLIVCLLCCVHTKIIIEIPFVTAPLSLHTVQISMQETAMLLLFRDLKPGTVFLYCQFMVCAAN